MFYLNLSQLQKKIVVAERGRSNAKWGRGISERGKNIYRENGKFPQSNEGIGYYRHLGVGGTVEISCANAVRPPDSYLAKMGIDIQDELSQIIRKLGVVPLPESHMGENTRQMTQAACRLNISMAPTPKFIDFKKCTMCAKCELICPQGAVWSTRRQLEEYRQSDNFTLLDNVIVEKILMNGSKAVAVTGNNDSQAIKIEADQIILSAGGLGTPVILQNSGIASGGNLHLDLYTVVYGRSKHFNHQRDIPMATVYQHPDDSFIIAPYIDIDLWHGLNHHGLSKWFGQGHVTGLMLKIADEGRGRVASDGRVYKRVTEKDQCIFDRGIELAKQILLNAGASEPSLTVIKPRGAHPGGTTAIGQVVDGDLKVNGCDNLFVADAGVLPFSLGKPPILTIMALAKRLGKSLMAA